MRFLSKYLVFFILLAIEVWILQTTYLSQFRREFGDYLFGDLFKIIVPFLLMLSVIWDVLDFENTRKIITLRTISSFILVGISYFFQLKIKSEINEDFRKPDLLVIHDRGIFGNSVFNFKKDKTYIFYENTGKMEGKFFRGNYKIIDDTVLFSKVEVWPGVFSDKLFLMKKYDRERMVEFFYKNNILPGRYFVGVDNR